MKQKMKWVSTLLALLSIQLSCAAEPTKITGFKTPESVVAAKDGRIYISEIGEFGKDGDGQISVVDKNGKVSVFASGMYDPKGLAMIKDILYVADKTRILKVTPDGKWQVFVPSEAFAATPQFLNDLEPDTLGNLYVSDSGDLKGAGGAIYLIDPAGKATLVIDGKQDPRVLTPNGLLMDDTGDVLIWVDFTSGILYSLNMKTHTMIDLASGFGGGDGVIHHPNGVMYVSDWKNGKLFSVVHDEVKLIQEGFKASADIALSADQKYILVPDMKAGELVWVPIK